jgi:predicted MFS family arabinose efflux permease
MIISVLCIPALSFVKDEPPSPPSVVAQETDNRMGVIDGLKELISNRNYIFLLLCFNFIYGIQSSYGTIFSTLASSYGYDVGTISICSLIFIAGGIFNAFFCGTILDKYQNYKKLMVILCIMCVVMQLFHFGAMPSRKTMLEAFANFLIGISTIPVSSVSYTFAAELAFPVPEYITNGIMITISLVWGTIVGVIGSALIDINALYALIMWTICAVIGLIFTIFVQ